MYCRIKYVMSSMVFISPQDLLKASKLPFNSDTKDVVSFRYTIRTPDQARRNITKLGLPIAHILV